MLLLPEALGNFIDTVNEGPDALHFALFAGPEDRVLLGLKAHANTISHARLVALEDTFPLTREEMGEPAFNCLSREFVEMSKARAADMNGLGSCYAEFLGSCGVVPSLTDLARIEWAWLQSYHASEANALGIAELGQLSGSALLQLSIALHPSAQFVLVSAPLANALGDLAGQRPAAVLLVRPEADVRVLPLDDRHWALLLLAAQEDCTLGNLLALSLEPNGEGVPLDPILYLIGAGALVKVGQFYERRQRFL